jgi:hypothetical protein
MEPPQTILHVYMYQYKFQSYAMLLKYALNVRKGCDCMLHFTSTKLNFSALWPNILFIMVQKCTFYATLWILAVIPLHEMFKLLPCEEHGARRPSTLLRSGPVTSESDILVRVLRGLPAERTPVWLMRQVCFSVGWLYTLMWLWTTTMQRFLQAGRYMSNFRSYSDKFTFKERSETPDIATELSLQPWKKFGVDGVIVFSGAHQ